MKTENIERLAYILGGLWLASKVLSGASWAKENVVKPIEKFVGPSTIPPSARRDALLAEIDKFKDTGYLDDDILAARATIANDNANADQKVAAMLTLEKKISIAKSFGQGARVAAVEAAAHDYMKNDVGPVASRVRLR